MKRSAWLLAIAAVAAGIWFLLPEDEPSKPAVVLDAPVISRPPAANRPALAAPAAGDLKSSLSHPMAASFGTAAIPPGREPAVLLGFFEIYRQEFGEFPTGEDNAQMMNALRGRNPEGMPIFPLAHPRLDPGGALLDAWGKPFIFHPIDAQHIEIRSTGPDREIFTADDILVPVRPWEGSR